MASLKKHKNQQQKTGLTCTKAETGSSPRTREKGPVRESTKRKTSSKNKNNHKTEEGKGGKREKERNGKDPFPIKNEIPD